MRRSAIRLLAASGLVWLCTGEWTGRGQVAHVDVTPSARPQPSTAIAETRNSTRALVLDLAARSITEVDLASGRQRTASYGPESVPRRGPFSNPRLITLKVFPKADTGTPAEMILSPTVGKLAVLDHGPGKDAARFGWHPSRRSIVVVMDSHSLRPLTALEGVWGLPILHRLSADGRRLTIAGPGYRSSKPHETRPAELVTIDLATAAVLARHDLGRLIPASSSREQKTNWDDRIATAALSRDGQYLYLLDKGRPSDDITKHVDGRILVVDTATGEMRTPLPAGAAPRELVVDEEGDQILLLSNHHPSARGAEDRQGELRVIRGDAIVATVLVAARPEFLRVSPDRALVHVFSPEAMTTLDAVTLRESGRARVTRAGISWSADVISDASTASTGEMVTLESLGAIEDAVISPDGQRAFVLHRLSSRLSIVDLRAQKVIATVTTGRPSRKILLKLTAAAASVASRWAAEQQARALGHGWYLYTTWFVLPARTRLVVGPDGKFVYVFNSQTSDISVVDAATARVVRHLPTPGPYLQILPDSHLLAAGDADELLFIDTRTNTTLPGRALLGQHTAITASPDGDRVFVLSQGRLTTMDPRSGESATNEREFVAPTQMLFDGPSHAVDSTTDAGPNPFELETGGVALPATRWLVLHLHKATKCDGWLYVTDDRLGFRSLSDQSHTWEASLDAIREIETNRTLAGGGRLGSFHVTLRDRGNYNFTLNGIAADRLVTQLREAVASSKVPK